MSWHERPYAGPGGGGGGWGFADNPLTWAPTIGSVAGIRIRVHLLFILYIIFELLQSKHSLAFEAQILFVLFGSVFLHELGHCFAARHVGGTADEVLLWPLGGLAFVDAPRRPWPQFVTVIWGPLVNVIIAMVAWFLMRFLIHVPLYDAPYAMSFRPLMWLVGESDQPLGSLWTWAAVTFRLNYIMFLFNMACPMYPMDCGRILQCALWHKMGEARSMLITSTVGMITAIVLGMLALSRGSIDFAILSVAMLGYIICLQQRQMVKAGMIGNEGFSEYDYSAGYDKPGRVRREGWLARWKRKRLEQQRLSDQKQAASEQVEVDRILAKVHDHGLQSLTRSERRTLETATRRQRDHESSMR